MVHNLPENFNISDFDVFHSALTSSTYTRYIYSHGYSQAYSSTYIYVTYHFRTRAYIGAGWTTRTPPQRM